MTKTVNYFGNPLILVCLYAHSDSARRYILYVMGNPFCPKKVGSF